MPEKTIVVRLRADTAQYTSAMVAAAKTQQGFATSVGASAARSQAQITRFGAAAATFGKIVTLGVAGGLALSAKAAIDFESSFTRVQKTVDATPAQFAALSDEIRQLAKEIPIGVNQLNQIAELGGQLGVSVGGITEFTDTIAKIGVTTNLAADQAALGFGRLGAILNLGEDEFDNLGSSLVELGNNFSTTEDQILTFALRIAPIGQTVGLSADEVLALATAFSSVGIPAERGGTAVQKAFISIQDAVVSGSEELEVFAEIAGQTAEDFSRAFRDDPAQAFASFINGLQRIQEEGGNVFEVLRDVELADQRVISSLLALSNSTGTLERALDSSARAYTDFNALNEEAEKQFETTAAKIQLAKNQIVDLGIELGENLLPIIGNLAEGFGGLLEAVQNLDPAFKQLIGTLLGLVALGTVGSKIVSGLAKLFPALSAALTTMGGAAIFARAALGGLIGIVAGTVIFGLADWGRELRERKEEVEELTEAIRIQSTALAGDTSLRDVIFNNLEPATELFNELGISVNQVADALTTRLRDGQVAPTLGRIRGEVTKLEKELGRLTDKSGTNLFTAEDEARLAEVTRLLQLYGFTLDIIEEQEIKVAEARDIAADEARSKNRQKAIDAEVNRLLELNDALDERDAVRFAKALNDVGDEAALSAEELETLRDNAAEVLDVFERDQDAASGFVNAIIRLREGMDELNSTTEPTLEQGLEIEQLWRNARQAAAELGPNGIEPLIQNFQALLAQGIITQEQFTFFLATLLAFDPVSQSFQSSADVVLGNMELIERVSRITGIAVADLINGVLAQSTGSFQAFTGNVDAVITRLQNLVRAAQRTNAIIPELVDGTINIQEVLNELARLQSLGSQIRDIPFIGSGGSGSSGGGGGTVDDIEEVVDALGELRDAYADVTGALSALRNQEDAVRNLADAEQELRDLRREQRRLPDEIAAAEERLKQARIAAKAVTTDEQLAIEKAEENLRRAQLAYEQGVITRTELTKAEEELAEAIAKSTNVSDDPDVIDAREDLNELKQRELEIEQEIEDAKLAVLDAQLAIIEAELRLLEAGQEFADLTKEQRDLFRELAAEAGLTEEAIERILRVARRIKDELDGTSLLPVGDPGGVGGDPVDDPPDGGGGTPSRQYVVRSGDTLYGIASNLGTTFNDLIAKNPTVFNQNTGLTRTLDPNLIYPGDVIKYHRGGIVPGQRHVESLALLQGGEMVIPNSPTNRHSLPGQMIMIENLNVRGVWDFAAPQAVERLMDNVERELETRRRASSAAVI